MHISVLFKQFVFNDSLIKLLHMIQCVYLLHIHVPTRTISIIYLKKFWNYCCLQLINSKRAN